MGRRRHLLTAAGALAVAGLALAGCQPAPDPPPPPASAETEPCSRLDAATEVFDLEAETPQQRQLGGGEVHAYRLDLDRGEFVRLLVDEDGIDVVAALLDPSGDRLLAVDRLGAGAERLPWRSAAAARHHLLVCASGEPTASGRYRVRVDARRPATAADRTAVEAAEAYAEAQDLRHRGEAQAAVAAYRRALERWQELGDPRRSDALFRLGRLHDRRLGEPATALGFYRRLLPLFAAEPDPRLEAYVLHGIGRSHFLLGEIDEARAPYERARALRRELGDRHGEAATANNLGLVYNVLGDTAAALAAYDLALEHWSGLENRKEQATTLHNRGQIYLTLGDRDQALADLERALAIHQAEGDRQQARTLTAIGKVLEKQGDLEAALERHREALALAEEFADRRLEAMILNSIGVADEELGRVESALDAYRRALPIFVELGDRRQQAIVRHNLGWLFTSLGRAEEALAEYRQALALKRETGDTWHLGTTLWGMAIAERRRGRLQAAREHVEGALAQIEDLRAQPAGQELRSSFFATKQQVYDFYVDLLMELHRRQPAAGHDAEALAASERARARSQLDALVASGADPWAGVEPARRRRLEELEDEIRGKELQRRRLAADRPTEQQLAAVEGKLHELLRQHRRLRSELGDGGAAATAPAAAPVLDARGIRERVLDAETLLLEIDLGAERSFLWAVTADGLASFELANREQIEAAARRAYELLAATPGRKARAQTALALGRLSDLLLGPVAGQLGEKRLLIAGEGALHLIPFAALPVPGGLPGAPREPLVSRHEIIHLPSASALAALRRRLDGRATTPGALAVVADPVFSAGDPRVAAARGGDPPDGGSSERAGGFERLAHSRAEAESILALLAPGAERFAAFGFAASRESVTGGELGRYRIVHFATHAEIDAEHPELSRLVLSLVDEEGRPRDGFLYGHEIHGLHLPAELVVLSACRTALGKEIRGEGLVGLTRSFFNAGAARLIVSLWEVDDRATAELMARFYRNLLQHGLPPAAALRAAQISIRRETVWRGSHFWAGFVLQGEWR